MKVHITQSQFEDKTIFGRRRGMMYHSRIRVELTEEEAVAVRKAAIDQEFLSVPAIYAGDDGVTTMDWSVKQLFDIGIVLGSYSKATLDKQVEDFKNVLKGLKAEIEAAMSDGVREETFEL